MRQARSKVPAGSRDELDYVIYKTENFVTVFEELAAVQGLLQTVIAAIDPKNGLFKYPGEGSHWYYDCVNFSGFNTYYSVFLYKVLCDLGEMDRLCGRPEPAARYLATAEKLRKAINTVLWKRMCRRSAVHRLD